MLSVALTGNVAAGKSAVAELWREAGVPVVSADVLAREAVAPGSPGLQEIREAFGDDVLTAGGALDRDAMRARVFADPAARERLEAIVHPRVWAARESWLKARRAQGADVVVSEIPLLFETGRQGDFDVTVLVDAPEPERLRRLVELRGLDAGEAQRIMDAQMDPATKRDLADIVLVNDGSLADLASRAAEVLASLQGAAT